MTNRDNPSPPRDETADLNSQERVARVVWALANWEKIRTGDVMKLTGLRMRAVETMLNCLARVVPIYRDDDGFWKRVDVIHCDN